MPLTMSTKFWLATRLIWMRVKGLCLLRRGKHWLMNTASSFSKLVPRQILMWSKFFSPLDATLSRGLLRPILSLRTRQSRLTTRRTKVLRHQQLSDLLAAAPERWSVFMIIGYLTLFVSRLVVIGRMSRRQL